MTNRLKKINDTMKNVVMMVAAIVAATVAFTASGAAKAVGEDERAAVIDSVSRSEVEPLVIIDGKRSCAKRFAELPLDSITALNILNAEDATEKFGAEGNNGALIVKTKSYKYVPADSVKKPRKPKHEIDKSKSTMPQFPGGGGALMDFLAKNVKYPPEASRQKIQGRVLVQFIVDKHGAMSDIRIVRSVHPLLDGEAMRVVLLLRNFKWIPGTIDGKPADVWYTLPLNFNLSRHR